MHWRFWLLEVPAFLWDLWWTLYKLLLMVLTVALVSLVVIELVLRAFGIRWGW